MFLRLSIPPQDAGHRRRLEALQVPVIPEPTYGSQLQNFSVQGLLAEGRMEISYTECPVALADGETVVLRRPAYKAAGLNYGPMHPDTMLSPRVASPMIGLGTPELLPEDAILAHADPEHANGDGLAGRPNAVCGGELLKR